MLLIRKLTYLEERGNKVREVSVQRLKEGDVLAKEIYSSNGKILLSKGVVLKSQYIDRLKQINMHGIYIEDDLTGDVIIEDVISDKHRFEAMNVIEKSCKIIQNPNNKEINTEINIKEAVSNIVQDILFRRK